MLTPQHSHTAIFMDVLYMRWLYCALIIFLALAVFTFFHSLYDMSFSRKVDCVSSLSMRLFCGVDLFIFFDSLWWRAWITMSRDGFARCVLLNKRRWLSLFFNLPYVFFTINNLPATESSPCWLITVHLVPMRYVWHSHSSYVHRLHSYGLTTIL